MSKVFLFLAVLVSAGSLSVCDEEPTQPSLASIAEATRNNKDNRKTTNGGRILTNDDLKKAKGNVIFLQPTAAPVPTAGRSEVLTSAHVPPATGDVVRQLDESRGRALRLRTTVEETQKNLADAPPGEGRTILEQQLRTALDELLQTHEAIGALNERMKPAEAGVPNPNPDPKN